MIQPSHRPLLAASRVPVKSAPINERAQDNGGCEAERPRSALDKAGADLNLEINSLIEEIDMLGGKLGPVRRPMAGYPGPGSDCDAERESSVVVASIESCSAKVSGARAMLRAISDSLDV